MSVVSTPTSPRSDRVRIRFGSGPWNGSDRDASARVNLVISAISWPLHVQVDRVWYVRGKGHIAVTSTRSEGIGG